MRLETIAVLMNTLGLAVYNTVDADLNEIWFGDTPERQNVFGLHTGAGSGLNLGINKKMTNYEVPIRIFYKGNEDYYGSYNAIKAAFLAFHGYAGDADINFIFVDQPDVGELGKNDAGNYEFSFDMTVYFKRLE